MSLRSIESRGCSGGGLAVGLVPQGTLPAAPPGCLPGGCPTEGVHREDSGESGAFSCLCSQGRKLVTPSSPKRGRERGEQGEEEGAGCFLSCLAELPPHTTFFSRRPLRASFGKGLKKRVGLLSHNSVAPLARSYLELLFRGFPPPRVSPIIIPIISTSA